MDPLVLAFVWLLLIVAVLSAWLLHERPPTAIEQPHPDIGEWATEAGPVSD